MYRGLIHFHSQYSYDSILKIKDIVSFALKENLNFLILTDHDTIVGSKELEKYIRQKGYDIEVVIAAEYNTTNGDIIALNIKEEIVNMEFDIFIKEVKEQDGVLLFPHPYKGHKNIEYIAKNVDLIEVFNARTDDMNNKKALELAEKFGKQKYYASDAHNYKSLNNSIIEFKKDGRLIESLLKSKIKQVTYKKTRYYEMYYSQIIKAFKYKNITLFFSILKTLLRFRFHEQI